MRTVELYFDFVSPYTYLLLTQAREFGRCHGVEWQPRPVVYAVLLNHTGLVGPVEVEAKRRYTFADVRRSASLLGVPLAGPPTHPFRSLEALRTVCLHLEDPRCLELATALARACWGDGRDLADLTTLAAVMAEVGLDASLLEVGISAKQTKDRLRQSTTDAIQRGVFGVPTCRLGEELFWGHDRLPHLAARLAADIPDPLDQIDRLLDRPRGADRKGPSGSAG